MDLGSLFQLLRRPALRTVAVLTVAGLLSPLWPQPVSAIYVNIPLTDYHSDCVACPIIEEGERVEELFGDFAISPDGAHVVYTTVQREWHQIVENGRRSYQLYSVPITGGASVRLNRHRKGEYGDSLYQFQISPNSKWVVYEEGITSENEEPAPELWAVPITGGVPVPMTASGHSIGNFAISPDSRYVVYTSPPDMYSVPITGGTPTLLTIPPAGQRTSGRDIYFEISSDSTQVVFQEHGTFDDEEERQIRSYIVPITGGTPVQIESPHGPYGWERFAITADSRHVVVERLINGLVFSVYSFPIEGGSTVPLSDDFEIRLFSHILFSRQAEMLPISVDPAQVFYQRWDVTGRLDTIVTVPVVGGDVTVLAAGEGPTQALYPIMLTADDTRLIYSGEDYRGTILYSTPVTQSQPVRLTPALDDTDNIEIAPVGSHVVYVTIEEVKDEEDMYSLYRVPVTGGEPVEIIRQRSQIDDVQISPDGSRLLFRSEAKTASGWFITPMSGGPIEMIPGLTDGEFTPNGTRIVHEMRDNLYVCLDGFVAHLPIVSNTSASTTAQP